MSSAASERPFCACMASECRAAGRAGQRCCSSLSILNLTLSLPFRSLTMVSMSSLWIYLASGRAAAEMCKLVMLQRSLVSAQWPQVSGERMGRRSCLLCWMPSEFVPECQSWRTAGALRRSCAASASILSASLVAITSCTIASPANGSAALRHAVLTVRVSRNLWTNCWSSRTPDCS